MKNLANKKILLGVCGGIAAYKSADLVRRLKDSGADVQVVMTTHAAEFVSPLTFQAVSGHPVRTQLFDHAAEAAMGHIELARWADLILIAPASANTLARLSHGLADDLLSTLCLATTAPVVVAPAMNQAMWAHAATQANVDRLRTHGVEILGPAEGDQACGETGAGRMLEPLQIRDAIVELLTPTPEHASLAGTPVLITAGPTREAIDPVRYISNHSSGKMGFAIADAAQRAGAKVTLVAGPTRLDAPAGVDLIAVESAQEMHAAVMQRASEAQIFIAVAAVADYRIKESGDRKLKKDADTLTLDFIKNPDILADVAALTDGRRPYCVGFAAETHDLESYAQSKLTRKNLDMIAANRVGSADDPVFNSDSNSLHVFIRNADPVQLPLAPKAQIARDLIALIAQHRQPT